MVVIRKPKKIVFYILKLNFDLYFTGELSDGPIEETFKKKRSITDRLGPKINRNFGEYDHNSKLPVIF